MSPILSAIYVCSILEASQYIKDNSTFLAKGVKKSCALYLHVYIIGPIVRAWVGVVHAVMSLYLKTDHVQGPSCTWPCSGYRY